MLAEKMNRGGLAGYKSSASTKRTNKRTQTLAKRTHCSICNSIDRAIAAYERRTGRCCLGSDENCFGGDSTFINDFPTTSEFPVHRIRAPPGSLAVHLLVPREVRNFNGLLSPCPEEPLPGHSVEFSSIILPIQTLDEGRPYCPVFGISSSLGY